MPSYTITLASGATYSVNPSDSSAWYSELTGDTWVELRFESAEYIELTPGSSIQFEGETYYIERPQDVTIVHRRDYEYQARFDSMGARLKYAPYMNADDGRLTFSVTGDANTHLGLLMTSANQRTSYTWTIGNTVYSSEQKVISYDTLTLWQALELIATEFGLEFEVVGTTIYLRKVEYNRHAPLSLSYGKGNGLLSGIQRHNYGDNPPVAALAVKGGDRNLNTSSSAEAYDSKTLHMPAAGVVHGYNNVIGYDGEKFAYLEAVSGGAYTYHQETGFAASSAKYYVISSDGRVLYYGGTNGDSPTMPVMSAGTKTDTLDLTDIYPQLLHTVTAVTTRQVSATDSRGETETFTEYTVTVSTTIDYREQRIPGTTPYVIFQSGNLAGREFEVNCDFDSQNNTCDFTIISKFVDDERMPGGIFIPSNGDTFRVFNVMLPYQYIRDDSDFSGAEWDMARKAVQYMWEYGEIHYTWEADMNGIFSAGMTAEDYAKIRIGGYVSFTDPAVQSDALLIRITQIKKPLNHPKWAEISLEDYTRLRWRRRQAAAAHSQQRLENLHMESSTRTNAYNVSLKPSYEDVTETVEEWTEDCVKEIVFNGTTYSAFGNVAMLPTLKTINNNSLVGAGDIAIEGGSSLPHTYLTAMRSLFGYGMECDDYTIGDSGVARFGTYGEPESTGTYSLNPLYRYMDTFLKLTVIADQQWVKEHIIDNADCDLYAVLQRYTEGKWRTFSLTNSYGTVYEKNIYRNTLAPVNMHDLTPMNASSEGAETGGNVCFTLPYTARDIIMSQMDFLYDDTFSQDYACLADVLVVGSGQNKYLARWQGRAIDIDMTDGPLRRFSHAFRVGMVRLGRYDSRSLRISETANYNSFYAGFEKVNSRLYCSIKVNHAVYRASRT